jgi:hypothetical protein
MYFKNLFRLILFIAGLSCQLTVFSQQSYGTISGTVLDSLDQPLPLATVLLLQASDSVMVQFVSTDEAGNFLFKRVPVAEPFLLQITYLGYAPFGRKVMLSAAAPELELARLKLRPLPFNLNEVLVNADRIPLQIRKDTIVYMAEAFQTPEGAVVEDLLKRLPGLEVDRQGNIKAQGEEVEEVLVDGKTFFGNDPKIATKNLPADAVDNVEVFDQKSEMANFSGIDDGQEKKTINLELKEDRKKGVFGNVEGHYGTEDRYQGKFNINRFSDQYQLSALGMANNTNELGFSINDYINFMGGMQNLMSGSGGTMRMSLNSEDTGLPLGFGMNQGITTTWSGGLNFNTDLGKKTELSSNYFFNRIQTDLDKEVFQENFLGDARFNSQRFSDQLSTSNNHRLNLNLRHRFNPMQRLSFRSSLNYSEAELERNADNQTFNTEKQLEIDGNQQYASLGENLRGNASLTFLQRFKKKGRVFSTDLNLGLRDDEAEGQLVSRNHFLLQDTVEYLRQRQENRGNDLSFGGKLSYTEPLGKGKYLEWNIQHQSFESEQEKAFFDVIDPEQQSEVRNEALSRAFERRYFFDRTGLNFKWNTAKMNLTGGMALQYSRIDGKLLDFNSSISRDFVNWLPSFRLDYEFASATNLDFSYRTRVQEPSLEQLQPIVDNSDPLRVYVGNPNLRPEYSHDLVLRFMHFNQFSGTSVFTLFNGGVTEHAITNAQSFDANLRQQIRPVNTDNRLRLYGTASVSTPLRWMKSNISLRADFRYNREIVFVNSLENRADRWNNTFELSLDNRHKKFVDAVIGAELEHNVLTYSIDEAFNTNFFTHTLFAEVELNIGKRWTLESRFDYSSFSQESFGGAQAIPLWEARISRVLLKKRAQLSLSVFDLLNRNTGIERNSSLNFLQETRYNALGRYFMLGLRYSLSGFGNDKGGIEFKSR